MRVLLTGASGFTGRYVADAFTASGAQVLPFAADLTDAAAVDRAVAEAAPDRVVHLAASAFVAAEDWRSFYQVNQLGSFNLLDAVARHRPGARCVVASSAQVYGPGASGLVDETRSPEPNNHYALSKRAMELGVRIWADRLPILVTRPFNYTGVGQESRYVVPKIVDHFRARASRIELGNIDVRREFGDVRAVADAYRALVMGDREEGVVNICTGRVHSIRDLVGILTEITGHEIDVAVDPALVRPNDVEMLGGDPARLSSMLRDWRPQALRETLEWMVTSPDP